MLRLPSAADGFVTTLVREPTARSSDAWRGRMPVTMMESPPNRSARKAPSWKAKGKILTKKKKKKRAAERRTSAQQEQASPPMAEGAAGDAEGMITSSYVPLQKVNYPGSLFDDSWQFGPDDEVVWVRMGGSRVTEEVRSFAAPREAQRRRAKRAMASIDRPTADGVRRCGARPGAHTAPSRGRACSRPLAPRAHRPAPALGPPARGRRRRQSSNRPGTRGGDVSLRASSRARARARHGGRVVALAAVARCRRRAQAREAGEDYWIDPADMVSQRPRQPAVPLNVTAGQISEERLKDEITRPYTQNWITCVVVAVEPRRCAGGSARARRVRARQDRDHAVRRAELDRGVVTESAAARGRRCPPPVLPLPPSATPRVPVSASHRATRSRGFSTRGVRVFCACAWSA